MKGLLSGFFDTGKSNLAKAVDQKAPKGSDKLEDISARLQDLDSRIKAEKKEQEEAEAPSRQFQGAADYSKGYRLVSEFVASILVGAAIGYGLDYLLGTLPLFLLIFLLAGFAASIVNMSRSANRNAPTADELAKMPKINDEDDEDK